MSGMHVLTVTGEQILLWFKLETFARQRCFVGFNDEILDVRCLPDNQRCVVRVVDMWCVLLRAPFSECVSIACI